MWQADLLRNASRYMWSHAKADPATLSATWLTWTVASGVAAVASLTIISGILRSTCNSRLTPRPALAPRSIIQAATWPTCARRRER